MSDQSVYFNTGLDTDERTDTNAIQPIVAGERVQAAVVDRPLEILRARTETLREQTEEQKFLQDSDIRWIITGGDPVGVASGNDMPRVTWNKTTSKFTIIGGDNDVVPCMILQPIQGPNTDKKGTHTYAFTGAVSGNVIASTTYFAYEGGARHQVVWATDAEADLGVNKCSVTFSGSPVHVMTITVAVEGTTTLLNLSAQLTVVGMPLNGFSVSFSGDMATLIDFTQIPPGDVTVTLTDTYDRELHYITKAQIDQFFITEGETITSGDTLGIYYPFMVDPNNPTTRGGRRQATPTSAPGGGGANTAVIAAQLFLASAEPEKIAQSIPICKRIGDDLIFIDGTVVRGDELTTPTGTVYFGANGYITRTFNSTTAGSSGATQVGVAAHTHHAGHNSVDVIDLTAATLQVNLEALQTLLNDKASLASNELLGGQWLFNNTSFVMEVITTTPFLMWRSGNIGVNRPADGQVGWQTISKYQILNGFEYAYVTIQGGYLVYSSGYKIQTPATGTGNLVVTIESVGSVTGHVADNNTRGSYRRYNAAAATLYDLYPSNWLTEYTSGFVSYDDTYTWWGTTLNLVATTTDILTTTLNIGAPTINELPIADVNTVGSKHTIHAYPTLTSLTGSLGTGNHAFFNRVLEGFMVQPAALVTISPGVYSGGHFTADTIEVSGGRAIVGGYVVTIPENRILSGVATSYLLPGTTLPSSAAENQWFGLWLRSDGVFRVGPLPVYNDNSGVPGNGAYMLPNVLYTEFGKGIHDYTLVNLVWSYQGNVAGSIYFAGITHMGGNLWVYQQARRSSSPGTWTTYVEHRIHDQYEHPGTLTTDADIDSIATSYNALTATALGLPGVPTGITRTMLLNTVMVSVITTSTHYASGYILANSGDTGSYSPSYLAPPAINDPAASPPALYDNYDALFDTTYAPVLLNRDFYSSDGSNIQVKFTDTLLCPTTNVYAGWKYSLDSGESFRFQIKTLGFMWDRYNAGGILF